jgi:hypothetical protein
MDAPAFNACPNEPLEAIPDEAVAGSAVSFPEARLGSLESIAKLETN